MKEKDQSQCKLQQDQNLIYCFKNVVHVDYSHIIIIVCIMYITVYISIIHNIGFVVSVINYI